MSSIGNLRALIVTAAMAALSAGCSTETTAVKTTATGDPAPAAIPQMAAKTSVALA